MDGLKEVVDTLATRVRSPVVGSIVLAFLLYNWANFAVLFFGQSDLDQRITDFKVAIGLPEFLNPALLGLAFAIALPWINLLGAILVAKPINLRGEYSDAWATKRSQKKTALAESLTLQAKAELEREAAEAAVETERRKAELAEITDNYEREAEVETERCKAELAEMKDKLDQQRLTLARQMEIGIPYDLILHALDSTDRTILEIAREDSGLKVSPGDDWTAIRGKAPRSQKKTSPSRERATQSLKKLCDANLIKASKDSERDFEITDMGESVAALI